MYGMDGWCKEIPGGDLISRAAVLEELADLYWTEERFLTFKDVDGVFDRIKALPSAQPERLTDDDFETIRIHLNAYKENLCNLHRWEEAEEYQRIIDRFMSFASAQPEKRTDKRTETHACDCISRAAAIDALDEIESEVADGYGFQYEKWRVHFCVLPSAQPKSYREGYQAGFKDAQPGIVRCKDCKWFNDIGCAIYIVDDSDKPTENDYCSYGERKDG